LLEVVSRTSSGDGGLGFVALALRPCDSDGDGREAVREAIVRRAVRWEAVVRLASEHLVTPTLYRALADQDLLPALPTEVSSYLEAVHELNGVRNRQIAAQLQELVALLNVAGIEPVLLKGVAYLQGNLYRDPAARVIGDIDLLVAREELPAAVAALTAEGYRAAGPADPGGSQHHHVPLARPDDIAAVELHVEPVVAAFAELLPAARLRARAERAGADNLRWLLPAAQHLVIHNIVHAQLTDRHYWCGRAPLRPLCDLARLCRPGAAALDWPEALAGFERAGYGSACRAWLLTAGRLFGQPLAPEVRPDLAARIACWRVRQQSRHPWLMAAGETYGYHRAILAEFGADASARRRLLARLLHPWGWRRYLRALRARIGRAH
jgi:hypothetical protein